MCSKGEIYGKVVTVLAETLVVDADVITPSTTLQADLGAESIDLMEISFRLEREFGISVPHRELFFESVFQSDPEFVREGMVTDNGMGELHARMPYVDLSSLDRERRSSAVRDLFTVDLLARYVECKLGLDVGSNSNGQRGITS
jgi:acyl carrier protein